MTLDIQQAFAFAGGLRDDFFADYAVSQLIAFVEWQEDEARWEWRMKWIGSPVFIGAMVAWAVAMFYSCLKG